MIAALLFGCAVDLSKARPLAYDHVACDNCAMLVSDPRFAAQLVTRDGERYEFDDPACWFGFVADKHPSIGNAWFRDGTAPDEVWLSWQQVAFVPTPGAPMDGGFMAVPIGSDVRALSLSEASGQWLSRPR